MAYALAYVIFFLYLCALFVRMTKKKILILQEDLFAIPDANAKLVFRIAMQLQEIGYDVSVLGIANKEAEQVEKYRGIRLIHEPDYKAKEVRHLKERLGRFHWLRYILRPRSIWYRINNDRYTPFSLETRSWLRKHTHEYDALIACCSPYYPLALAAEVADRIPVIYYKIDPVGSWGDKSNGDAALSTIENEIKWDNVAARIIMPDVVYRDYMRLPTKVNGHKTTVAQFPNVRPIVPHQQRSKIVVSFEKDKINLLFVGKFYAEIRHPQYLFDLMEQLRDTPIVLHIVGPLNYMGFDQAYIDRYFTNKIPNIQFHGAVPPTEADDILLYADGLVHLGNSVDTAMPSKILDYISSGKPILNICKIPTCPTLPLMERYPIGLTIYERSDVSDQYSVVSCRSSVISEEIVEQVKEFCITNKGKQIPYEQIERLYPECTIEYVGNQFEETIQAAINEFKTNKI